MIRVMLVSGETLDINDGWALLSASRAFQIENGAIRILRSEDATAAVFSLAHVVAVIVMPDSPAT